MKLKGAQMTLRRGEDWSIITPDGEVLATLPRSLTDKDMIGIMEFAQKYEREAYHEGAAAGRATMEAAMSERARVLLNRIQGLEAHNAMLASKLEQYYETGLN